MLKRLVWFTLPALVFALVAPSVTAAAAPTLPQLEAVAKQIDVSAAAGAISPGIAKSLKVKIASASDAIEIHAPARVYGNLATPSLVIQKGSVFEGNCRMESLENDRPIIRPNGRDTLLTDA